MTSKEVFEKINEVMKREGIFIEMLALKTGINAETLECSLRKKSGLIYNTLDILDGVGLELQLDNKPIDTHQDIIDYISYFSASMATISRKTGINPSTIKKFTSGENVQMEKAIKIINAYGIDIKII